MALETVEVTVLDDQVVPQPVNGVVVRVFDSSGTAFITEATTGVPLSGKVQFTLNGNGPAPETYQLRFFVNGGSIQSPQYIEVYSPPALAPTGANNFRVTASMFSLPQATNPRLCRASGYVWGPDGRLRPGIDIDLIPQFKPLVVDGYGVLGERVSIRTDATGYVAVDLLRCGIYLATIESQENYNRTIYVPERSSINLFHLLFPVVANIVYAPAGPWAMASGSTLTLTPTVTSNDFRTLTGTASADVDYTTDDPLIASVSVDVNTITLKANAPGNTVLRATRRDNSVVYIPDSGINNGVIAISVT